MPWTACAWPGGPGWADQWPPDDVPVQLALAPRGRPAPALVCEPARAPAAGARRTLGRAGRRQWWPQRAPERGRLCLCRPPERPAHGATAVGLATRAARPMPRARTRSSTCWPSCARRGWWPSIARPISRCCCRTWTRSRGPRAAAACSPGGCPCSTRPSGSRGCSRWRGHCSRARHSGRGCSPWRCCSCWRCSMHRRCGPMVCSGWPRRALPHWPRCSTCRSSCCTNWLTGWPSGAGAGRCARPASR